MDNKFDSSNQSCTRGGVDARSPLSFRIIIGCEDEPFGVDTSAPEFCLDPGGSPIHKRKDGLKILLSPCKIVPEHDRFVVVTTPPLRVRFVVVIDLSDGPEAISGFPSACWTPDNNTRTLLHEGFVQVLGSVEACSDSHVLANIVIGDIAESVSVPSESPIYGDEIIASSLSWSYSKLDTRTYSSCFFTTIGNAVFDSTPRGFEVGFLRPTLQACDHPSRPCFRKVDTKLKVGSAAFTSFVLSDEPTGFIFNDVLQTLCLFNKVLFVLQLVICQYKGSTKPPSAASPLLILHETMTVAPRG